MKKQETIQGVLFFREFVELLDGDVLAALMLSQIIYWYRPGETGKSRLRVCRPDGSWWLVKSHADWNKELGFTQDQSRRCLEVLKRKGVIETNVWGFQGKPTVHLRCVLISGKALSNSELVELLKQAPFRDTAHLQMGPSPYTNGPQAISNTEITTKTTTEIKTPAGKPATPPEEESMNGSEAVKKIKDRNPNTLPALWKKRMALYHDGYEKELPKKEAAQLNSIRKVAGDQTVPVIDYVFENWLPFAQKVKILKGLATSPAMPHIGFLLANIEVALQLISVSKALPVKAVQKIPTKTEVTLTEPDKEPEEVPHKMTAEEIMAELEKFSPSPNG